MPQSYRIHSTVLGVDPVDCESVGRSGLECRRIFQRISMSKEMSKQLQSLMGNIPGKAVGLVVKKKQDPRGVQIVGDEQFFYRCEHSS